MEDSNKKNKKLTENKLPHQLNTNRHSELSQTEDEEDLLDQNKGHSESNDVSIAINN